ncbi:hypothetical protein [Streptacidiphilus albus]|uniref:hypothetical protein n=1 Tax=Streptacidiphilus albus TaxID=105425 RepID=UPI00068F3C12|nr:hypothetical protein [Streptacidiphilus albus]
MCANDMRAAAVLAVPFLIRIAADIRHPHRAAALAEVSCPARALHFGVASRDELLLHRAGTRDSLYDGYGVEVTGYPAGWSVAAARAAITADIALLQPLLGDPDPATRISATYALATAADPDHMVRAAFRTLLGTEQDPIVRAALVLATAEATRTHRPPSGYESCGGTGHRPPRSDWPPRPAGSVSPANPPPTACAPPSTASPPASAPTPWTPCPGWPQLAGPARGDCGTASGSCSIPNSPARRCTTPRGRHLADGTAAADVPLRLDSSVCTQVPYYIARATGLPETLCARPISAP